MNNRFDQKWRWVIFQTVVVINLLSGCGGGSGSTILINGVEIVSGIASATVTLDVGQILIEVVVTSDNGLTSQTYTLSVLRTNANSEANLSHLDLAGAVLDRISTKPNGL